MIENVVVLDDSSALANETLQTEQRTNIYRRGVALRGVTGLVNELEVRASIRAAFRFRSVVVGDQSLSSLVHLACAQGAHASGLLRKKIRKVGLIVGREFADESL